MIRGQRCELGAGPPGVALRAASIAFWSILGGGSRSPSLGSQPQSRGKGRKTGRAAPACSTPCWTLGSGCRYCLHRMWVCVPQLCLTLTTGTTYSPPGSSVHGIFLQEYWSGLPFPSPGDLPDPGIEPGSPALQAESLPPSHQGSLLPSQPPCNSPLAPMKLRSPLDPPHPSQRLWKRQLPAAGDNPSRRVPRLGQLGVWEGLAPHSVLAAREKTSLSSREITPPPPTHTPVCGITPVHPHPGL